MTSHSSPSMSSDEAFFMHLQRAQAITQKFAETALMKAGITVAEYTLMRIIENTPAITAGQARARLYATAPSVAQIVAQLIGKKLLMRGKDPSDARRLPLTLTPRGKKALHNAKQAISQLISSLKLPAGLLDSLTRNLSTFLSSLPPYGSR